MNNQERFRSRSLIWLLLFFFALQLFIGFLVVDGNTLTFDESIWHYIGRNWFRYGLVPYRGGVDNKSPFMFALYGFSDLLFGTNYWFPRLLGAFAQTFGIFFLFRLVEKKYGYTAAILAISIYGLSLAWKSTGGKFISYTESYEISLIIAAFYFFMKDNKNRSYFLSGFLSGFAIFFRLTGIFGALTLLLSCLRKEKKCVLLFLSGLTSSMLIFILLMKFEGVSPMDIFKYGVAENFGSGSVTDHSFLWRLDNISTGLFHSELVLFLPGLVSYILIKKRVDIFIGWFILAFIGLNVIGLYARQHFRELLPPLSIMTALSITYVTERFQTNLKLVLIVIWICFFPKQIEPLLALKKVVFNSPEPKKIFCDDDNKKVYDEDKRALGEWIENNSIIKDKVFIAGMSAVVQVYSVRLSPTIYFNATETVNARKRIMEDLAAHEPEFILIPKFSDYLRIDSPVRNFIEAMVIKDYRYETCKFNYAVYRLREK